MRPPPTPAPIAAKISYIILESMRQFSRGHLKGVLEYMKNNYQVSILKGGQGLPRLTIDKEFYDMAIFFVEKNK